MENLQDHIARKQERSNILINSGTKIRPGSSKKNIQKEYKPNAVKKIDLGFGSSNTFNFTSTKTTTATAAKCPTPKKIIPAINTYLPKPQLNAVSKAMISLHNNTSITQRKAVVVKPVARAVLKPPQQPKSVKPNSTVNSATTSQPNKPMFNLSTSLKKPAPSSSTKGANDTTLFSHNATFAGNGEDKTKSRLQRHMDLFKGRVPATRTNDAAAIRNVRSNRRFELLMQHRKNLKN